LLGGATSYTGGSTQATSSDTGSVIDFSKITNFFSDANNASLLQTQSGGQILTPKLATLNDANLIVDGAASMSTQQITSFTNAGIEVDGGEPDFSGLTNIDGDSLDANGGVLSLPSVNSYTGVSAYHSYFTAQNAGTLNLSNITTLHGGLQGAVLFINSSGRRKHCTGRGNVLHRRRHADRFRWRGHCRRHLPDNRLLFRCQQRFQLRNLRWRGDPRPRSHDMQ